jgi:hypothetical protein
MTREIVRACCTSIEHQLSSCRIERGKLGLAFGRDVRTAFELGCGQIGLEDLPGEATPQLITRPGVDAATVVPSSGRRPLLAAGPEGKAAMGREAGAVEVFFSYSQKDKVLRDQLEAHLANLKRQGIIAGWHDRRITAGTEWREAIDEHLESARMILLLVSTNFLSSDYCYDIEMRRAMERHERGEARVIPVILRPCDWHTTPFGRLQALPLDGKPVSEWNSRDRAFLDIADGIRKVVAELS